MFVYTALGDSITFGENAKSPCLAYPSRVVSTLARTMRGEGATGGVLAEPGWTASTLRGAVLENSSTYLRQSDAISIFIGGDDLARAGIAISRGAKKTVIAAALKNYELNLTRLVEEIRSVSRASIILCTQYNPFPNSPLAVEGIAALNTATQTVAEAMHCIVAPVHLWFEGRVGTLISGYHTGRLENVLTSAHLPIHPNDSGHAVIATGLLPLIGRSRQS